MAKKRILKKRKGYSYNHPKTGRRIKVKSHKQHYNVNPKKYKKISNPHPHNGDEKIRRDLRGVIDFVNDFETYEDFLDYKTTHRPREISRLDAILGFDEEPYTVKNMDIPEIRGYLETLGVYDKDTITIYRGTNREEIEAGDWVSLEKEYAKMHNEKVIKKEVPIEDLKWGLTNKEEWFYVPKKVREKFQKYDTRDFYEYCKKGED